MKEPVLQRLTTIQEDHALEVVLLFTFLTAAMAPGMARVETIVALENMMPASSDPVQGFNTLRAEGIGKDTIAVQLTAGQTEHGIQDITNDRAEQYIAGLTDDIRDIYGITAVHNPFQRPGLISRDRQTAVIVASTYMGDSGQAMERMFNEIREQTRYERPEGIKATLSGVPAVQQRLASMVQHDKNLTTAISLLLVFLITLALFQGSLTASFMPLLVVALSVIWLYGTMGYLGIPLSTLAGSVAALVIGIGIDYSIHILNTYRYHRHETSVKEALSEAVGETGVALIATSVTTISAFMAFLSGAMPEMHRFGLIMSIGIGYALMFSFFLLPAVFVLEEQVLETIHDRLQWRHDFP
ncbi:MAG: efflux RND transporter permease subunit [Candidatus Nanohaloarchaea archaeon]|nr:efflux RND transporter permease subunit [Candidatus Nanohaloarchaea archaeon]